MRVIPSLKENKGLLIVLLIVSAAAATLSIKPSGVISTAYVYVEKCPSILYLNDPSILTSLSAQIAIETPDPKTNVFLVKSISQNGANTASLELKKYIVAVKAWERTITFSDIKILPNFVMKNDPLDLLWKFFGYAVLSAMAVVVWANKKRLLYEDWGTYEV